MAERLAGESGMDNDRVSVRADLYERIVWALGEARQPTPDTHTSMSRCDCSLCKLLRDLADDQREHDLTPKEQG